MFSKTISYKDLSGNPQTEEFFFHLTQAEIVKMEVSQNGGLSKFAAKVQEATDNEGIIQIFEDLILKSIGRASDDGKRFIKNDEIRYEFFQSEAYSAFFMHLLTNVDEGIAFFNNLVPQHMLKELDEAAKRAQAEIEKHEANQEKTPAKVYTDDELLKVDDDEFYEAAGSRHVKDMDSRFKYLAFQRKELARA